jgi:glycine cleavage system H protein
MYPEEYLYTKDHEWLQVQANTATVGITDFAQHELGDVVYVDLPNVGSKFGRMEPFGTIEAVKAVSELYCPISGEVVEINGALEADPSLINKDPYVGGWMIRLRVKSPAELDELMGPDAYASHVGQ